MRNYLLLLATALVVNTTFSQNTIGIPDIVNYTKSIYSAGTQNRCITQDRNGLMYFANYEGLLTFDGSYWKIYPLPDKMIIRSLAIGSDNKIYVGSHDFGYFSPAGNGKLVYTSLKHLLPPNTIISEIWETVAFGNDVFFRSRDLIVHLHNQAVNVYRPTGEWQFLGKSNNRLFAQDSKTGLLEYKQGVWQPVFKAGSFPGAMLVTSMFPYGKDSTFITTVNSGFYILSGSELSRFEFKRTDPFKSQRILTATPVSDDLIAVGTNLQGCYIIDKKGEIIQNLSRKEGLQMNNILYLFVDSHKNLWLGLDNGIDFIAINNQIRHIYPENLNEGEGYTSLVYQNTLYVGTSNGVYKVPLTQEKDISFVNGKFEAIPNTGGSSFGLAEINKNLLLGHHDGFFKVVNAKVIPISNGNSETFWTFLKLDANDPSSLILAGTSKGLNFVKYENNNFSIIKTLPGFNESSHFVALDNKNLIWVAHPYRGIFRINASDRDHPVYKFYTNVDGLPSAFNNHLFKIKNRIVVATINGLYEYNESTDRFEFSKFFEKNFGHGNIRYLKEDSSGNIWFIENKNLGVVDYSFQTPKLIYFPELDGKMVDGFEHIYPYDSKNIFVGAEKGFYHINYENYKKINNTSIQVRINNVKAFGKSDSLLFGGYFGHVNEVSTRAKETLTTVGHGWNSLHFEYSSPLYEHFNSLEFSYLLEGYDEKWSDWTKKTEKDYTNLSGGNYVFKVKAKTNLGKESEITSYAVNILPPWYKSNAAYVFYLVFFILFNYLFYIKLKKIFQNQKRKHEEQQRNLQMRHQLELEKSEKEIIALKNEKLQAELQYKNTELASVAMHLVQKGDVLSKVKEELHKLKKASGNEIAPDNFKKLIRVIKDEDNTEEEWQQFATHFDAVRLDFLKLLKKNYPALTPNELKLCAYLQMNLGSKDIAKHLKISVRGVSTSRYRLRKKMQVPNKINLFDFLMEFTSTRV